MGAILVGTAAKAATATTAATAATAGLVGAGGAMTLGGVLGTALTLGSAGLTLGGSVAQSRAMAGQAEWQGFEAGQEALRGEQDANRVREALIRTLASNAAARAAGGLGETGSPAVVDRAVAEDADRELRVVDANTRSRTASARAGAANARASGRSALLGGAAAAGGGLFDYIDRRAGIG